MIFGLKAGPKKCHVKNKGSYVSLVDLTKVFDRLGLLIIFEKLLAS